ncbi:MmcQ/YjbR family DNA-binding protein [Devosia beringensis]|uniref:MmcQ/YjbR family DNA-binding protein n=1 Tax=Devosia beringensis TaxID=2657486 RepID=UPI00186B7AA4|nr:MmcQ/YjbR family DNA-binding protein [Devosia beringensis]
MATQADLRRLAMALAGTVEAPHVDRRAFKVNRIYATLAADGDSANLKFTPDEQALKCMVAPDLFAALDNAWGRQGWTTLTLAAATEADLAAALAMAHAHAITKPTRKR